MLLNKGAKAKFYVPSVLGYGKQSMGDRIPENSILKKKLDDFIVELDDIIKKLKD
jgi:FKBP-type peptidyl-prolyl cis-trans isomerase